MRARLIAFVVAAAGGCNTPDYISERRPLETMADPMGGGFLSDTDLFVLPIRRPTAPERHALQQQQMQLGLMQPLPWASIHDFDIEIEWTAKNLDNQKVQVTFTINGGNEFGDYVPANFIDPNVPADEQPVPPPLFGNTPLDLAPNETRSGILREDQTKEAAIDLEAITRYPDPSGFDATPFEVIEHDSTISQIGLGSVPPSDVTPAWVRYALSIASDGHVSLDYTVRVRDHAGKIASPTATNLYVSTASVLTPPAAPPMMMAAPPGG